MTTTQNIGGVDITKVNRFVLEAAYLKTTNKEPKGSTPQLVSEIAEAFKPLMTKEIGECENCGGVSPVELFSACPFCGVGDEDDAPAVAAPSSVEAVEAPSDESGVLETAKETPKAKAKTKRTMVKATPTAIEVARDARELDAAVARVHEFSKAGASALWSLGVELRKIYDQDLWKLRNDEEGKPLYKTFSKFLSAEVQIHERTVYRMMTVTKEFHEGQAEKYGVSILRGLLAAPKEDREEVLDKLDRGEVKGTRGVAREVEEIRKRKGVKHVPGAGKGEGRGKASAKGAKASAKAKAAEKRKVITVALPVGRRTVKLFARQMKKGDPEKRAKRLADRPWGKLECSNGVTIFAAVVENGAGELELSIEARRED